MFPLRLLQGIHAATKNFLQVFTKKSLTLAQEEFLLSLEFFLAAALFYWAAVFVGVFEKQQDTLKPNSRFLSKMELPHFALGSLPKETKRQKRERLQKQREQKRKDALRKQRLKVVFDPVSKKSHWFLLPSHRVEGLDFWIHTLKGNSFLEKRSSLLQSIEMMKTPEKPVLGFDPAFGEKMRKEYLVKAQKVMSYLHENQMLRWKFKPFFTNWRIQRFRKINDTDPITLEPFKQPVFVYEFSQQKTYRFEAESIAKHIHKQLAKNDGQIPTPQPPRNPLTNTFFRIEQVISILKQCKAFGFSSWILEAFVSSRYDITSFLAIYTKPLRLNALKTSMADEGSWDFIDTMSDFIQSQHTLHGKSYSKVTYEWAITHASEEDRMKRWKKLCLKWYETDIVVDDPDAKEVFLGVIESKTKSLCDPPVELVALRQRRKTMRLAEANGSRSAGHTESTG